MRVTFHGVRGSTSAPGVEYARYGGHTSCVAVAGEPSGRLLVLDAGTGLRQLGAALGRAPFRGTILLSHLHWDHTDGLPFFTAGDRDDAEVAVAMPEQGDPIEVLDRFLGPPHFPITVRQLRGTWSFQALTPGEHTVEGFEVLALEVPHKGGRTFGYRITGGGGTVTYIPDHGPDGAFTTEAVRLAAGANVLIHDAQFANHDRERARSYGHATVGDAIELGVQGGVGRVLLFHHDPARDDGGIDELLATARGLAAGRLDVDAAREEDTITIG